MKNLERKYSKVTGIYRIYSLIDNRCYIGSSRNLYSRVNSHLKALLANRHSNTKLQRFVNKYGIDKLQAEVVLICKRSELCDKEDQQRIIFNSFKRGFDLLEFSYRSDGHFWTEAQKAKHKDKTQERLSRNLPKLLINLEKARIGYAIAIAEGRIKPTFCGKKHKETSKAKMREAKLGKSTSRKGTKFTTNPGQPVYQIDKMGIRIDYASAQEAAKITGIEYKTLQQRIKYKRIGRDGSSWFYTDLNYRGKLN